MQRTFRFYKTAKNEWFVDVEEWPGDLSELQMVEGADIWIEMIAVNKETCYIELADEPMENSEVLTLTHIRDPKLSGGGDYLLHSYNNKVLHHDLWLCGITEFVFRSLPERIWFRDQTK